MTTSLFLIATMLSVAAGQSDAPPAAATDAAPGGAVANRSQAAAVPSSSAVVAESEDRPIPREGSRGAGRSGSAASSADAANNGTTTGWRGWLRGWAPLAGVLLLIGVLVWALRRWMPKSAGLSGRGMIEILGRQYLSPKQSVALLKVGRRVVLVGMTSDRLTRLETIADPAEVAEIVGRSATRKPGSLTDAFQRDVLREAAAYEPGDAEAEAGSDDGLAPGVPDESEAYVGTRRQLRGLLHRVRRLSGSAER